MARLNAQQQMRMLAQREASRQANLTPEQKLILNLKAAMNAAGMYDTGLEPTGVPIPQSALEDVARAQAAIAANPAAAALWEQEKAAAKATMSSGGILTKIGDTVVEATPTLMKIAAAAALGDIASLASGGSGLFGGTGQFLGAPATTSGASAGGGAFSGTEGSLFGAGGATPGASSGLGQLSATGSTGLYGGAGGLTALPSGGMIGTGAVSAGESAIGGVGAGGAAGAGAGGITAGQIAGTGGGLFGTGITGTQALSTGLGLIGSALQGRSATDAARQSANAQIEAARIAAEASRFRPVGVTTRFGQSQFGYDPQGNLVSAGYQLSPELKAQQDALMAMSGQALTQYQGAPAATAPMAQGAQTLFGLGQGYLATTPQEQAAKFMAEQQALLAPTREREMAALQARLQAQGRLGLATGGTSTGLMASNPELEALYNAQRMQDLQLAAQATQGGQQYATFGAGLLGTGGELQKSMYGTQQAAFAPYQTALGGATTLESLGQQPMDIGTSIGAKTSTAAARAGEFVGQGMLGAAQTMQPANAYSPWGALLTGAGQAIGQYGQPQQQQYRFDPFSGRAL